jgi:hypothetical protein
MTFAQVRELFKSLFAEEYRDPERPAFTAPEFQLHMQRARDGDKQHLMAVISFEGRGVQVNIAILWTLGDDREMVERKFHHACANLRNAILGHFQAIENAAARHKEKHPVEAAAIDAGKAEGRLHDEPGQA